MRTKKTNKRSGGLQPQDKAKPRKPKGTQTRKARPADTIRRSVRQTEGIWYVVRGPERWHFCPLEIGPKTEIQGHPAFWERIVAPKLARAYKLSAPDSRELALHAYGFPRGRVALVDGVLKFYHGNDWQRFISREEIENHFNPDAAASQWLFDEHETQLDWDREQVRRVLRLRPHVHQPLSANFSRNSTR